MEPSLPELRLTCSVALRFCGVAYPEQLEIRIGEKEPAVCRALTRMGVRGTLQEPFLYEKCRFGRSEVAADKDMIQFDAQSGPVPGGVEQRSAALLVPSKKIFGRRGSL